MTTTPEIQINEPLFTFWDHLDELRKTLIKSLFTFFCFFIVIFFFHHQLIDLVVSSLPLQHDLEQVFNSTKYPMIYQVPDNWSVQNVEGGKILNKHAWIIDPEGHLEIVYQPSLILLSPYEGLLSALKVSSWAAFAAASPFCFYFLSQFLFPALYEHERKMWFPALFFGYLMVILGIFFALKVTIPIANSYLWDLNHSLGTNMWTLPSYLDHFFMLLNAHAIAFAMMSILVILIHFQTLKADFLTSYRRHFIVIALILSAVLTPPDIFSQIYLAAILIFFYEMAILYSLWRRYYRTGI